MTSTHIFTRAFSRAFTPAIGKGAASPIVVTLTAGVSGTQEGYETGVFGSISEEPIAGESLICIYRAPSVGTGVVYFVGNRVAAFAGLEVYVDDIRYPFTSDWAYLSKNDQTIAEWASNPPPFSNGITYELQIK